MGADRERRRLLASAVFVNRIHPFVNLPPLPKNSWLTVSLFGNGYPQLAAWKIAEGHSRISAQRFVRFIHPLA
jgi:hypothetical protein